MASPTQDDSLVFADDTRWGSKHASGAEIPDTSNFSPISERTFEPTQIDQSTSPVFRERSYSSSDENDLSLSTIPQHALGDEDTDGTISTASGPALASLEGREDFEHERDPQRRLEEQLNYKDTQVIPERRRKALSVRSLIDADTQVIEREPRIEHNTNIAKDTLIVNQISIQKEKNIEEEMPVPETQAEVDNIADTQIIQAGTDNLVIHQQGNSDTQLIPITEAHIPRFPTDTQIIQRRPSDSQIILKALSDTQVIQRQLSDTQIVQKGLPNTQSIQNGPSDTQVIQKDLSDTQIIQKSLEKEIMLKPSSESRSGDSKASNPDTTVIDTPKNSLEDSSALWKHTQPITQLPDLHPDTITQVVSSPTKVSEFEPDTTLLLSPARPLDEPTTQVLNTQEDLFDEISEVDLGHKPVYSSGQNEEKLQSQLSIVSNDEDMRLEENNMLYEDSVFQHKRKRRRMESELETYINDEEGHGDNMKSPTPEIHDSINEEFQEKPTAHKLAWSQSSSELEDVSHDVQDLDLNAFTNMEDYDESNDKILVPTKRRRNEIPATQSQKSQSQISHLERSQQEKSLSEAKTYASKMDLREEYLDTLDLQAIQNPKAVWAFSQFKHYPARVLEAGETMSLIEFADLAQVEMKNTDIYLMDLRVGDVVHLIQNFGEYIVTGLAEVYPDADFRCIRGYDTVYLTKKGRHNAGKEVQVPISDVYMEVGEWASHQQKHHIFHEQIDLILENFGVVKGLIGTPHEVQDYPLCVKTSPKKLTDANGKSLRSNLFQGMVFFVTSIEGERKDKLAEVITTNGGVFIDDEIKHYTMLERSADGRLLLSLTKFDGFHFGALLADGYSRSAKYLQALALGWPILAESFIEQAISNPDMLDNWQVYLLPAGQSLFTNGVKSLEIFDFRMNCAKEISMNSQLGNNLHLLASYNLVVLNKKQDARTLDMCGFIFHAYGAQSLKECLNVLEIKSVVQNRNLKNILVYDNAAKEYTASQTKKTVRRSQKLKHTTIGIIDWEWVVQCVISGYVWQPSTTIAL